MQSMPAIKDNFRFALNFLRNPLRNASFVPSSTRASRAMLEGINFSAIDSVVELGPGTGVFTRELLKRCKPQAKILLVEVEESYVKMLREQFGGKVIIEHSSAHLLDTLLAKHGIREVGLIVSGLPFSLPEPVKRKLFDSVRRHTSNDTIFRFFTYNPPLMRRAYKSLPVRKISFVLGNIPPLWVYGIN